MIAAKRILLCSDLDRTLLPNGIEKESPQARSLLHKIADRPELTLVYVSGRNRDLLIEAIEQYDLPVPDYAIGDVGTTIYTTAGGDWRHWAQWDSEIARDWRGMTHDDVTALFDTYPELELQPAVQQNAHKVSYFVADPAARHALVERMRSALADAGIGASLVWSVDETRELGLLDVVPERATKLHAIQFLMKEKGYDQRHTVFAGDSGNDVPVLTSGIQSVLVRNASDAVRDEVLARVESAGLGRSLYQAHGGFLNMNGNYCAGVLEGLAHFIPETRHWMMV